MKLRILTAAAFALTTASGAAFAQQQEGLVNVNLSDIQVDIARDLDVNVSQIPVTVQVPVGVAANVCGVEANVLAQGGGGQAECTATSTSQALNKVVQRQMGSQ